MPADDANHHPRSLRAERPLPLSRSQILGAAALGLAVASIPGSPALAQGADGKVDVLLIGGGIMSETLGVWLNALEPNWSI